MEFKIVSDDGSITRIDIVGDLSPDRPEAFPLHESLGDAIYAKRVLLNLEGSPFINSPGLGWLLMNHRKFREAGGHCVMHSVPPAVLQAMKLMQLDRRLPLANDATEAAVKVMEAAK